MSSTLAVSIHDYDPNRNSYDTSNAASHSQPDGRRSVSPHALHHFETPGASSSAVSCHSDLEDDPFFGGPSFVEDEDIYLQRVPIASAAPSATAATNSTTTAFPPFKPNFLPGYEPSRHAADPLYPMTPEPTASIHTASPRSELRAPVTRPHPGQPPASISPQELQKPFTNNNPIITRSSQLTPSQSSSARTSEDGLAPAPFNMQAQSPRVTVSVWDQDEPAPTRTIERTFDHERSEVHGGYHSAGDLISSGNQDPHSASTLRDESGRWQRDFATGQAGVAPQNRSTEEVTSSINDLDKERQSEERNDEVGRWLTGNLNELSAPNEVPEGDLKTLERTRTDSDDNIPLGHTTQNVPVPGQTYYSPNGGPMSEEDLHIIASDQNWADAPRIHEIQHGVRNQPQTSQEAIARFERMYRDTDSILSRQATWGTRRRSIHSTADIDVEVSLSGNLLKKLTISKNTDKTNRAGNLLDNLRGLVQRRPSISSFRKRRSSNASDDGQQQDVGLPLQKQESAPTPHLAPPDRESSWGKKPKPSLNTAFGAMGSGATSPGRNHSRKSSVGAISISSPRGWLDSLKVENTLTRPRSRSEAPKPTATPDSNNGSLPNLMSMWKATGGPPVASLRRTSVQIEPEDEDEDDEDLHEDSEMVADANLIDTVTPNLAGFQGHVITLNPQMDGRHNYLVDRIAHQQIVRYKNLLGLRVKHLGLGTNCPCGPLCIAMGGQADVLEQKPDSKGVDPLASHFPDDDDDAMPADGAIGQDSFPQDIPMPPTQYLPAEFECQLCFSRKRFTKPSDWTKHVHEDVQPFTCTWNNCRDAKSFKRKADWVRHENEGHRHLEWWTCDVEECRHTCYRRDNFLQHLVREHKFLEPKHKTKAAIKKAGGNDATWKKVDECHVLTSTRPQEEPCRFCGKTFPTWKKLTVHLAKHMEQISLPVLRLVAAKTKEIDANTIISPVQDLPPRTAFPLPAEPPATMGTDWANMGMNHAVPNGGGSYADGSYDMYAVMPGGGNGHQFGQSNYYPNQYGNLEQTLQPTAMGVGNMGHDFGNHGQVQNMPMGGVPYVQNPNQFMSMPQEGGGADGGGGSEPFPAYTEGLGLHDIGGNGMGYNSMMDTTASASPFSGQGTSSPYMHSPHQHGGHGGDGGWDERHMPRFQ